MSEQGVNGRTFEIARTADQAALGEVLGHAFGFPVAAAPDWFALALPENVMVYRAGEEVLGGVLLVPMAQWFGGRSVPMIGLSGVGMTPERRGAGEGHAMMRAALREMRRRGAAISTLYPSTVPFYRKVGYERAGTRCLVSVRPSELSARPCDDGLTVTRVASVESAELAALQRRWAARHEGALDRGPYVWGRAVAPPRENPPTSFAIRRGATLVGHLTVLHKTFDGHDTELTVVDAMADDGPAAERILRVLASYRSIAAMVRWQMHLPSLFSMSLAERTHEIRVVDHWLVRVLDAHAALSARGYRRGARARVDLDLDDPLFPEHHGRFTLDIQDGAARVTPGGAGGRPASGPGSTTRAVTMGPRGLAALVSGFMSASELARLGLLAGAIGDLEALDGAMHGALPTMAEAF